VVAVGVGYDAEVDIGELVVERFKSLNDAPRRTVVEPCVYEYKVFSLGYEGVDDRKETSHAVLDHADVLNSHD
jgi:hypothetical protein